MAKKLTPEDLQAFAQKKGGRYLSDRYVNGVRRVRLQCKNGHMWESQLNSLKEGRWCRECYRLSKYLTIEEMQQIAESRGGKCLSDKYADSKTKLKWQCKFGHMWEAVPSSIKMGAWCFTCAIKERGDKRRQTIEELQELARSRGGECLSKEYLHSGDKLQWRCVDGHTWWSDPGNIKSHWCATCAQGLSERVCRKVFEAIFKEPFPSRKPSWLLGMKGGRMELDGYNEKLGLAFEYQGEQHYKRHEMFHKEASFEERQHLDELKRRLCKEHNVVLIEVPYTVDYEQMLGYIFHECVSRGIDIAETDWIDHTNLDAYSPRKLKELQEIAKKRGGECLSTAYLGANTKMKWRCKEGHEWETVPKVIKRGNWCSVCSGRHKWTIKDMREFAEGKDGNCLSDEYIDNTTRLRWQCKKGHQWDSAPSNVLSGYWCPHCARNFRLTIEDMRKLAEERGWKCISEIYINANTKLKWQCDKGHIFESTPNNVKGGIKQGRGCPRCAGKYKTIKDIHKVAEAKGGQCLSVTYLGTNVKHRWRCKLGHEWSATPAHILRDTWCPFCKGGVRKDKIHIKCKQCGKEFLVVPSIVETTKYCSKRCHNLSKVEQIAWNKGKHYSVPSRRKPRVKRGCVYCGKTFQLLACEMKRAGQGKYCSRVCSDKSKIGKRRSV